MRLKPARPGYAMMLVVVFVVLFLSLWSLAYRQTAAAARVEAARARQALRDEGSLHALARALALHSSPKPPPPAPRARPPGPRPTTAGPRRSATT
jgi:hypothetical protein